MGLTIIHISSSILLSVIWVLANHAYYINSPKKNVGFAHGTLNRTLIPANISVHTILLHKLITGLRCWLNLVWIHLFELSFWNLIGNRIQNTNSAWCERRLCLLVAVWILSISIIVVIADCAHVIEIYYVTLQEQPIFPDFVKSV